MKVCTITDRTERSYVGVISCRVKIRGSKEGKLTITYPTLLLGENDDNVVLDRPFDRLLHSLLSRCIDL